MMDSIVLNTKQIALFKKLIQRKLNASLNKAFATSYKVDEDEIYEDWQYELSGDDYTLFYVFKEMGGRLSDFTIRIKS